MTTLIGTIAIMLTISVYTMSNSLEIKLLITLIDLPIILLKTNKVIILGIVGFAIKKELKSRLYSNKLKPPLKNLQNYIS